MFPPQDVLIGLSNLGLSIEYLFGLKTSQMHLGLNNYRGDFSRPKEGFSHINQIYKRAELGDADSVTVCHSGLSAQ